MLGTHEVQINCPICRHRISQWEINTGKTEEYGKVLCPLIVHRSCLMDFKSRYGRDFIVSDAQKREVKN